MTEAQIADGATEQPERPKQPRKRAARKPRTPRTAAVPTDGKIHVHHVHFLEDGVTALDKVFVRGEEVEVREGTPWWEMLHDKEGNCLFAMTPTDQARKFGKQLWGEGPWPFDPYDLQAKLDDGKTLTPEEQAILKKENEKRERSHHQPVGGSRNAEQVRRRR
jgi:hypothetical protein